MKIGVSGAIGSGKSTFIKAFLEEYDFVYIDADIIAKNAQKDSRIIEFVKKYVTNGIIDNKINVPALREAVFLDKKLNNKYTSLIWPIIETNINNLLFNNKNVIIEAAMIQKLNLKLDFNILIKTTSIETNLKRVKNRDNKDFEQTVSVIDFQMEILKNQKFDLVIKNDNNTNWKKEISNLKDLIVID